MVDGKREKCLVGGVFLGVFALWIAAGCIVYRSFDAWQERGQFGDMFGAVNALFSGLAFAGLVVTIFLQGKELARSARAHEESSETLARQLQSTMWATLDAIVHVERSIAGVPSAIRFHGITQQQLTDAGISTDEFAYLLASFTAGHIYHMSHHPDDTGPFPKDSYRYRMFEAPDTRRAWPLLRRCLNYTSYVRSLDATLALIQRGAERE